jgi:hypothetical protein
MMTFDELLAMIVGPASSDSSDLDDLYQTLIANRGSGALEDDFSIVRFAL